jgi:hypothetical protein
MATVRPLAQTLGQPRSVQGIDFHTGTTLFFGLANELVLSVIPDDKLIGDVPCASGLVHFQPCGKLGQATLAREYALHGITFGPATTLSWNEDGTLLARLVSPHRVADVALPAGANVRITDDGKIESWSRRLHTVESPAGVACQEGSVVTRYGDGTLQRVTLEGDQACGGFTALDGSDLEFHTNGAVAAVTLAASVSRAGFTFEPGDQLVFRSDGTLSVAHLAHATTRGDEQFPEGAYLRFDDREQLTSHVSQTWRVERQVA